MIYFGTMNWDLLEPCKINWEIVGLNFGTLRERRDICELIMKVADINAI